MEQIIEQIFGLGFWRRNPKKQKQVEHETVKRNLVRASRSYSGYYNDPDFTSTERAESHVN